MKLLLALLLLPSIASAEDRWLFEFEFGVPIVYSSSRLLLPQCTKVVPVQYVKLYAADPRPGWEISCGNEVPIYNHFLGRRIGRPLPNLVVEMGWRHLSSPGDHNEFEYDSLSVRGRFQWGKR
jgi:hypothetical protein